MRTVADLQRVPRGDLQAWFGQVTGETVWRFAQGMDTRPLVVRKPRKR